MFGLEDKHLSGRMAYLICKDSLYGFNLSSLNQPMILTCFMKEIPATVRQLLRHVWLACSLNRKLAGDLSIFWRKCAEMVFFILVGVIRLGATRYGLDGLGIESRWGTRFSTPVQTGPGAHPASYTMGTGSFLGIKRPRRGVDHPPHLVPRLKKE